MNSSLFSVEHLHTGLRSCSRGIVGILIVASFLHTTGCSRDRASNDDMAMIKASAKDKVDARLTQWNRLEVPVRSSAHIWRDTLSVMVQMRNTTSKDLILLPSLLDVNVGDSTLSVPRTDAMGVMFYGMIQHWKAGWDDPLGFDWQYQLQFVQFKKDSMIAFTYKVPMNAYQARKLRSIRYMHGLEFPAWDAEDTLIQQIATNTLVGSEFVFDGVHTPNNGTQFADPWVVNVGTESWKWAIQISEQDFYRLGASKVGNVVDSAAESMMVVSKGQVQPRSPKHVTPAYIINEEVNKAAAKAEREARP